MTVPLDDLTAFAVVARTGGFREGARAASASASALSEAVRRLESRVGVRLLNRTTRSVAPTEAGRRLLDRLSPALADIEAALEAVASTSDQPAGVLRLNVPVVAARLVLPSILPPFLSAFPAIRVEIVADDSFADLPLTGCDAGIRYEERLEQDMIAVPMGPRTQRFATAAAPSYLNAYGRPQHPRDLINHACLRFRFASGVAPVWEFEREGELVRVDPPGPLIFSSGSAADLAIAAAEAEVGVIHLFEEWLTPSLRDGRLEPVLQEWWQPFNGPFLYYPGRRLVPSALKAFIEFIQGSPPNSLPTSSPRAV